MNKTVLKTDNLCRTFFQGGNTLNVLDNANIEVKSGEIVALVGPSGSGKSTLLQTIGLLDTPTSGGLYITGKEAHQLKDKERTRLRRDDIGFIYQFHNLLPEFSARENIMLPLIIAGKKKEEAQARADELLALLGIDHRADHRPATLSGGEQQRVAIGRALANEPGLLLADEPTGNLDPATSETVFRLLIKVVRTEGVAAIIATHNMELARRMDRRIEFRDGRIESIENA